MSKPFPKPDSRPDTRADGRPDTKPGAKSAAKPDAKPTEAELQILQALWRRSSGTVRDVHADLGERTGYTSVLKLMQIMTDKGLLLRDERGRTHIYRPASPEATTQRRLAADLISRAFGGSARKLVIAALSSKRASKQELDEIRRLLDELKGDAP